jgi:hypothetical protein
MLFSENAVSLNISERERTGRELRAKLATRLRLSSGICSEVLNFSTGDVPTNRFGLSEVRVLVESENDLGENTAPHC